MTEEKLTRQKTLPCTACNDDSERTGLVGPNGETKIPKRKKETTGDESRPHIHPVPRYRKMGKRRDDYRKEARCEREKKASGEKMKR